jgi:hypothetical protein
MKFDFSFNCHLLPTIQTTIIHFMKTPILFSLGASFALATSASAAITYFDAPSSNSGTTFTVDGITTTWQQHDGTGFVDFDDSQSSNTAMTSSNWQFRNTGPAANANSTTAYQSQSDVTKPPKQLRVIFSGLDAAKTYQFYFYSTAAGGDGGANAAISTDITRTAAYTGLNLYDRAESSAIQVLSDGTPGDPGSGDRRYQNTVGATITGQTSYAFIIDHHDPIPNARDRDTFDGVGIATVPEPSSEAILGLLGGLALILRRRK